MKKILLLFICLLVNIYVCAQVQDDVICSAKYRIVGKGISGQESCSGNIYIVRKGPSYTVKLNLTGKFAQTHSVWGAKTLDEMNRIYEDYYYKFDRTSDRTDILVQICSNNSNVRFVTFRHYARDGKYYDEVYKTMVEVEKE